MSRDVSNGIESIDNVYKYSNANDRRISVMFDKETWNSNQLYHINMQHVFDPSKFWICINYQELKTFYKYVQDIYRNHRSEYRVPLKKIKKDMYCIVFAREYYFRATLIEVPLVIKNDCLACVRLIDYGSIEKVPIQEIYYMTNKLYTVPELSIRATLSSLAPVDSNTWSFDVAQEFLSLTSCKKFLCHVISTDCKNKILYVRLWQYSLQPKKFIPISYTLIKEKLARRLTMSDFEEMKVVRDKSKHKHKPVKKPFQFLLPTFQDIENCYSAVFDYEEYLYYLSL